MKKRAVYWMICAACAFSMMMAASGQGEFGERLRQKLRRYYERHVPLKIHLTFNQPTYVPGDTAFYGVRLFTAEDYLPIGGRQIINVLLLNAQGDRIQSHRVLVNRGKAINQLPLPADLPPGIYSVVAFHPVMEHKDPALFFQMPLYVRGAEKYGLQPSPREITFFPEGGNLVAGIRNKIVAFGPPGKSATILAHDAGVASFTFNDQGLGVFFLKPTTETPYRVLSAGAERATLPALQTDGAGLLVTVPVNRAPIRVIVQVPEESVLRDEDLVLAMTSHSKVYATATVGLRDNNFITLSFPQQDLPEGVAQFTLFDSNGQSLAERLVYITGEAPSSARIALQDQKVEVRDSVAVTITLRDGSGALVGGNVSVRVYHEELLSPPEIEPKRIGENAPLWGDVGIGKKGISREDMSMLDLYLITQRWKRFSWEEVWQEKLPATPFRRFLHMKGKAHSSDGAPLPDSTIVTFFLQRSVMTYEVPVSPSGDFEFSLVLDFFGEEELFYRVESRGKWLPMVEVSLDNEYKNLPPGFPMLRTNLRDESFARAQQRMQIDRSYRFHSQKPTLKRPPSLNALIEDEVFGADVVVDFEDYYLFPTMSETLREIVPMLQHRRQRSRDIVRLFFDDRDRFAGQEPLFVIDGVITDNTLYFLGLNPVDVVSIRVLNSYEKLSTFGAIGKNGIVLVETRIPGNAANVPRSAYMFTAQGLTAPAWQPERSVSAAATRVPDLRAALYWNPDVQVDSTGTASLSFCASDVTGSFRIEVEGFTDKGAPIFGEGSFRVQFSERP